MLPSFTHINQTSQFPNLNVNWTLSSQRFLQRNRINVTKSVPVYQYLHTYICMYIQT